MILQMELSRFFKNKTSWVINLLAPAVIVLFISLACVSVLDSQAESVLCLCCDAEDWARLSELGGSSDLEFHDVDFDIEGFVNAGKNHFALVVSDGVRLCFNSSLLMNSSAFSEASHVALRIAAYLSAPESYAAYVQDAPVIEKIDLAGSSFAAATEFSVYFGLTFIMGFFALLANANSKIMDCFLDEEERGTGNILRLSGYSPSKTVWEKAAAVFLGSLPAALIFAASGLAALFLFAPAAITRCIAGFGSILSFAGSVLAILLSSLILSCGITVLLGCVCCSGQNSRAEWMHFLPNLFTILFSGMAFPCLLSQSKVLMFIPLTNAAAQSLERLKGGPLSFSCLISMVSALAIGLICTAWGADLMKKGDYNADDH